MRLRTHNLSAPVCTRALLPQGLRIATGAALILQGGDGMAAKSRTWTGYMPAARARAALTGPKWEPLRYLCGHEYYGMSDDANAALTWLSRYKSGIQPEDLPGGAVRVRVTVEVLSDGD